MSKRTIQNTSFGEVTLDYKVYASDGKNPEQGVCVTTPDGKIIGNIFGTLLYDITPDQIEETCSYDNTVR